METIKTLKRSAGNIKAQLTRFNNFLTSLQEIPSHENIIAVECRLKVIEPLLQQFDDILFQIENITSEDSQELESEQRIAFETLYFDCLTKAKYYINRACNTRTFSQENNINSSNGLSTIKLPTIELPKFNGHYEEWVEFYDTFNSLIHNNVSLNEIQKFHYLRSSLKGEASKLIASLEVSAGNYHVAWQILRERYENKKLIINKHVSNLFNLQPVTKESPIALRQLLDELNKHTRALIALGQPVEHWDTLLVYISTNKFDPTTRREWESFDSEQTMPTMESLTKFLSRRCQILENIYPKVHPQNTTGVKMEKYKAKAASFHSTIPQGCKMCGNAHPIFSCRQFIEMPIQARISAAKRLNLCINCLKGGHSTRDCPSHYSCRKCEKRHNTFLHKEVATVSNTSATTGTNEQTENLQVTHSSVAKLENDLGNVLLPTAIVRVQDIAGKYQSCRALLDSGSQANFITEDLSNRLGLQKLPVNSVIYGINGLSSGIEHKTEISIQSAHSKFRANISCLVVPTITNALPFYSFNITDFKIPRNLKLADSKFNKSSNIDLLIGSSDFWQLLCAGQIKIPDSNMILQKTKLGWIAAGPLATQHGSNSTLNYLAIGCATNLEQQVAKFWSLEDCSTTVSVSKEDLKLEEHFVTTTKRDSFGRFIVNIPKKETVTNLGESRSVALKRFYNLEKKIQKNPKLLKEYTEFINEYLQLGHMQAIEEKLHEEKTAYYLPHHPVIKETSLTTKLRVVFDGSCKTTTGLSLNDVQYVPEVVLNQ